MVHDYPGGAASLAPRIGVSSPAVLDNKVNPRQKHHKLSVDEFVRCMARTGNLKPLDAMESQFGRVATLMPCYEGISDTALLETYTGMMKEIGEFSVVFHNVLEDGRITRAEIKLMRKELRDFQQAGEELVNRAEQLVDDDPAEPGSGQ